MYILTIYHENFNHYHKNLKLPSWKSGPVITYEIGTFSQSVLPKLPNSSDHIHNDFEYVEVNNSLDHIKYSKIGYEYGDVIFY